MNIVVFHRLNDYTGSSRVISNVIASQFSDDKVYVVTNNCCGRGLLDGLANVKVISLYCPTINGRNIKFISFIISRLHQLILSIGFIFIADLFYVNTITQYIPALIAGIFGKKLIYHVHEKFINVNIEVKLMEWVFRTVKSKRIYVSHWLMDQYDIKCTQSLVIYNKLSDFYLQNVRPRPIEIRTRTHIVMLSSLTRAKGVVQLLNIASLLPELCFTMVISADMSDIQDFFTVDVPLNVHIVSSTMDIHIYLSDADLLLNLSNPALWIETFGMTILEAMPYGIPAIVPNKGGPTELVLDGYNGYCVDVTDADVVKAAIQQALDPKNYRRLVANTFERFNQINS